VGGAVPDADHAVERARGHEAGWTHSQRDNSEGVPLGFRFQGLGFRV
jgi:hypothetical protein